MFGPYLRPLAESCQGLDSIATCPWSEGTGLTGPHGHLSQTHPSLENVTMSRRRRVACVFILIVDLGYIAWGGMAALFLNHLLGPGGKPILPAGYEGFTKGSWSELARTAPTTANYF